MMTSLRILLADDEDSFRLTLKTALSQMGYIVDACESGEEAIELIRKKPFDVIILDYRMPGLSGLNVLQWMYEQKMETPVIMLTAAGTEAIAVEAMKLGAYDYLTKDSIQFDHLPITINSAHERYLFKKEKEMIDQIDQQRVKNVKAAEMFHETLGSLTHIVNNTLSLLSLNIEEGTQMLLPYVREDARERFANSMREIMQGFNVIASSVRSMLELSNTVYERVVSASESPAIDESIRARVRVLEDAHKQNMSA